MAVVLLRHLQISLFGGARSAHALVPGGVAQLRRARSLQNVVKALQVNFELLVTFCIELLDLRVNERYFTVFFLELLLLHIFHTLIDGLLILYHFVVELFADFDLVVVNQVLYHVLYLT